MPGERALTDRDEAAAIEAAASSFGLALPSDAALGMAKHARVVREVGETLNLTRILDPDAMRVRHVVDSLLPLVVWPEAVRTAGRAIDLGSGAGYPGIPLALAGAAMEVVLLDATAKKAAFLDQAAQLVGAPAQGIWGRAEGASAVVGPVERVWVRAVGPLAMLVELGFGLLAPGGMVVAWKGPEAEGDESDQANIACRKLGGEYLGVRTFSLPNEAGRRTLFAYRRGPGALPRGIPRAPAVIRRRPLGVG